MIFALVDRWRFVRKKGKYGDNQPDGGMAIAFDCGVPPDVVEDLRPGDMIFTQGTKSWLSWAMLYLTSSPVNHVANYIGDGNVLHMTLSGSKIHPLRVLAKDARVLPVRLNPICMDVWFAVTEAEEYRMGPKKKKISHHLPPKCQLAWVAILIVLGFFPDRFRWKSLFDILLLLFTIDLLSFYLFDFIFMFPIAGVVGITGILNWLGARWQDWIGHQTRALSHPDIAYRAFFQTGGLVFTRLGTLFTCEIGILPLNMALSLSRERPDDSSDDQFQKARQFFYDSLEGLDIIQKTNNSEDKDRDKDDNQ